MTILFNILNFNTRFYKKQLVLYSLYSNNLGTKFWINQKASANSRGFFIYTVKISLDNLPKLNMNQV